VSWPHSIHNPTTPPPAHLQIGRTGHGRGIFFRSSLKLFIFVWNFAFLHLRSAPFQPPWRYLWRGQSWAKDREPQDNVWLGSNVQLMSIVFPMCFVPAKKNMLMKSPSLSPWKMVTSSRRLSWWLDHPCLWRKFEPVAQLLAMLI